eukprot:242693_1
MPLIIDLQNAIVLKQRILDLFENVNTYKFYTTSPDGGNQYEICLRSLLQWIQSPKAPNNLKVIINATSVYDRNNNERNWIAKKFALMKDEFTKCNWTCEHSHKVNVRRTDRLVISQYGSDEFATDELTLPNPILADHAQTDDIKQQTQKKRVIEIKQKQNNATVSEFNLQTLKTLKTSMDSPQQKVDIHTNISLNPDLMVFEDSIEDHQDNDLNANGFDLLLFEEEDTMVGLGCSVNADNYKECQGTRRLIAATKYYSTLNIDNTNDRELATKFSNETYRQLIDDYIHFNNHHSHELEAINNDLPVHCQILSCASTSRHHRQDTSMNKNNLTPQLNFFAQTMDSVHFYLFHCFDIGIRTKHEPRQQISEEEQKNNNKYFDAAFSRLNKMIAERHYTTKAFERFSTKNTKFTITHGAKEFKNKINGDNTYLDEIYKHLKQRKVSNTNIRKLQQFILQEEYDTDTFEYDITIQSSSNVLIWIQNYDLMQKIQNFFDSTKYSMNSFAFGLRFYYWDHYKSIKQLGSDEDWWKYNFNDHSGYAVHDLFI